MFESHSVSEAQCVEWGDIEGSYPFNKWHLRDYYVPMNVPTFRSLLSRGWHSYSSLWPHTVISQMSPRASCEFPLALRRCSCLGAETKGGHVQFTPKHSMHHVPSPTHPSSHICHTTCAPPCLSFILTGWFHIFFSLFWFVACCTTVLCLVCVFLASLQTWPAPYPLYIKAIPQTHPQPSLILWPQPCSVLCHLWLLSVFQ